MENENIFNLDKFAIVFCECGSDYIAKGMKKHLRTHKHIEFMRSYIKPQPVLIR